MKVCEGCVNKYQLMKYVLFDPKSHEEEMLEPDEFWSDFEKAYDEMKNRTAWCTHCYDELI